MDADITTASALAQLGQAYAAGLLVSLTPCVYPLIPITLSIFGSSPEAGRARSFLLAVSYVLGIACTYTALGMISALGGGLFGALLGNPFVVGLIGAILVLLACSTLDLLGNGMLSRLQNFGSRVGGKGFRGAFLMGSVSGIVAAPCVGPVLVLILGIAASEGQAIWGALLLFVYALGFGTLFLCLGAFPGLLQRLPKSGPWLHGVKFLIAVALFLAFFFVTKSLVYDQLPELSLQPNQAAALFGVTGALLAWYAIQKHQGPLKLTAAALLAFAFFPFLVEPAHESSLTWQSTFRATLDDARQRGELAMIDIYADWCAACKEFEVKTFSDPAVQKELQRFSLGRLDFTTPDEELSEQYAISGLPCILFLKADGTEIPGTRISGFLNPQEFIKHLKQVP